jgi:hypothetical protein
MSKVCQPTLPARDPVEVLLARIVWNTLRGSLLGSAVLAAGCAGGDAPQHQTNASTRAEPADGGTLTDTNEVAPRGSADPCALGSSFPVRASSLTLQEPHDSAEIRRVKNPATPEPDAGAWGLTDFELLSQTGTPCATATDAACAETVHGHPTNLIVQDCNTKGCAEYSVVTTRGNEVKRAATPAELLALLGAIDSQDDALMLVTAHSYDVSCPGPGALLSRHPEHWVLEVAGGYELIAARYAETCPVVVREFRLFVGNDGELRELGHTDFADPPGRTTCIGRVPEGLTPRVAQRSKNALGEHLAACAHLEAASVHAFIRLADELCAHGAPKELVERALLAAQDEVRHAQVVSALARFHDGELTAPEVCSLPLRSLEQIARENAVEGCVRETYGALVGAHQALRASDPYLRDALQSIAADEARHAALSHDVDAWLMARLAGDARARVRAAQRRAIEELLAESLREPEPSLHLAAGLPSADTSRKLLAGLARELWQVAV